MGLRLLGLRAGRISWAFAAGLVACASLSAGGSALATTLECSPGQNLVGSPPSDPRYAVAATMVQFGPMGWRIEHRLANGTIASRNAQYAIWDASTRGSIQWRGRLTRNPDLLMVGGVFASAIPDHLTYKEWLYDTARAGALLVLTEADCVAVGGAPVVTQAQPAPPPAPAPSVNPEAAAARDKLIKDADQAYDACLVAQMKQVVPYSNESGAVLSQVVVTNCRPQEQRVIDLVMAIYGASRADAERVIQRGVETRKGNVLADIVTFRAELAKSLAEAPNRNGAPKLDNASSEAGKGDAGL